MSILHKLYTDKDFQDAVDQERLIRVFKDNHIVEHRALVVRFSENQVITQSGVSDLTYHDRAKCEFFLLKL